MKRMSFAFGAAVVSLVLGLSPAWGAWEGLNGPLNEHSAFATSLAVDGGIPWVAFADPDGSGNGGIYLKSFDGAHWNLLGANPINTTGTYQSANAPSIAIDAAGNKYVAWHQDENDLGLRQIFVKWNDGTGWADKGTNPLNNVAANKASAPRIALSSGGVPYVAWHEDNGSGITQILVKKYNGSDWEPVGTLPVNQDPAHSAQLAAIAVDGDGNPFVAWQEEDGSVLPVTQVFVKKFDGTDWEPVGTDNPLNKNAGSNAYAPRIAFQGAVPYVTWHEQDPGADLKTQVYVKSYDSGLDLWAFVGGSGSLNAAADQSAVFPSIAFDTDGHPFAVWYEGTPAFEDVVFAKKFNGASWGLVARLNMGDTYNAEMPEIAFDDVDGLPYINWLEEDASYDFQVRAVKSTPTFTALKSFTATPCPSAVCISVAWETDMEPENAGFHVWRLVDLPGEVYTQITPTLIPAEGTETTGASYELVDNAVVSGQKYFYKLEDVNIESASTLHAAVSAVAPTVTPPAWGAASTVNGTAGMSGPLNALGLLVVLPLAALLFLVRVSLRRKTLRSA
jgi:hypothetical protein